MTSLIFNWKCIESKSIILKHSPKERRRLSDLSKFNKLKEYPTLLREGQLQCFLRKRRKMVKLIATPMTKGSQPVWTYGLPKMHKVPSSRFDQFLLSTLLFLRWELTITIWPSIFVAYEPPSYSNFIYQKQLAIDRETSETCSTV